MVEKDSTNNTKIKILHNLEDRRGCVTIQD